MRLYSLGAIEVLTLIFVVLKLIGTVTWSWWWVLSPLWIGYGFILLLLLGGLVFRD